MKKMDKIKIFLRGELPKSTMVKRIVPLIIFILLGGIFIANLLFDGVYDWRYMVISDLSSSTANPRGYLVASYAMAIVGVFMIPIMGFMHRRLTVICRGSAIFGTFFFLIGIIGLTLLGIIYERPGLPNRLHENLAVVGLGGVIFAMFFWEFPMIKDALPRYHGKNQWNKNKMLFAVIMMWIVVLGMGASQIYTSMADLDWVGIEWAELGISPLASFAFWEWAAVICLLIYFVLIIQATPERVESLEK
jgi:hypothetical protein